MVGVLFSVTSGAVIGGWAGGVAEVVQDVVLGVGGLQLVLPPAGGLGAWGGAGSLRAGGDVGGPGEQAQDQPHQDDQAHQQQAGHNQHPRTAAGEGLLGEGPRKALDCSYRWRRHIGVWQVVATPTSGYIHQHHTIS